MPLDALMKALLERTGDRVVLPNGRVWKPKAEDDRAATNDDLDELQQRLKLTVSPETLPPKVRGSDGRVLEDEVPLWVEIAIDY